MFNLTPAEEEKALEIHKDSIVLDAHCDSLLRVLRSNNKLGLLAPEGQLDLRRLHTGGISVQFFAAFIESEFKPGRSLFRTLQILDVFFCEIEKNRNQLMHVLSYRDIEKSVRENKIAAILAVEGGECLEGDLATLRMLYRLGVRSLGLTWNQRNEIADGVWERISGGGLTNFGRQVIIEMNNLGMLVDLAHISEKGFWDVLEISTKPVIVSHANCYPLCNHPRNLTDKQIIALAKKEGVVGITFAPEFVSENNADLEHVLDHIDHIAKIAGTDYIGLGSDYDGIDQTPTGLEDVSKYNNITRGLVERGYTTREIKGILGENFLRVIKKVFRQKE